MHLNDDALAMLHSLQDEVDRAASSYWRAAAGDFSVKQDGTVHGTTVLGLPVQPADPIRILAHRLLQTPFILLGFWRYRRFRDTLRLGRLVARRTDRMFTYDILRQVLSLALVRDHISLAGDGSCALVIGDGFGVMTSLLALAAPSRKVIAVNLTKPLLLDVIHIRRAIPDAAVALAETDSDMRAALADGTVRVIAVRADNASIVARAPIGLAVNIVSMQEMNPETVAAYFAILRQNPAPETIFYCANKLSKTLPDGTVARFADYPWHADDAILDDAVCTWAQWTYSRRPPFWHYRKGKHRVIWHRLARLAKNRPVAT